MANDPTIDRSQGFAMLQRLNERIRALDSAAASERFEADTSMASDREYVDLKLEASEARLDARFVELHGKLDRVIFEFENYNKNISEIRAEAQAQRGEVRSEYLSIKTTIVITGVATAIALAALLMAVITYGDAIFGRGMSVRDVVSAVIKEQSEKAPPDKSAIPQKGN